MEAKDVIGNGKAPAKSGSPWSALPSGADFQQHEKTGEEEDYGNFLSLWRGPVIMVLWLRSKASLKQ